MSITLKVIAYYYVDGDIICVTVQDDRGVKYSGSLEIEESDDEYMEESL